jgi:hypothetical protein
VIAISSFIRSGPQKIKR